MEAGEFGTNTLLVSNISSVAYRIYEPLPEHHQTFPSAAIDVECILRDDGHLVFYDATRRAIWQFGIEQKDGTSSAAAEPPRTLKTAGFTLILTEEAIFEPSKLQRTRSHAPSSINTPVSASSTGATQDHTARTINLSLSQGLQAGGHESDARSADLMDVDAKPPQTTVRMAYEFFIAAVLLSTSTRFCPAIGAVPLNYRTVLLPSTSDQRARETDTNDLPKGSSILGTFSAYLTTQGSLIISLQLSLCNGLLSLDNVFASTYGQTILAAPFGVQATNPLSAVADPGTVSLAQTPATQALSVRGLPDVDERKWKQNCIKTLQSRGIPPATIEGCTWVSISVSRRRVCDTRSEPRRHRDGSVMASIPWPGPLCFRQKTLETSTGTRLANDTLNGHEESHDPLGTARRWLSCASERDGQIAKRKAMRAISAPGDNEHAPQSGLPPTAPTPAALARPGTTVASAMYPTPPDGVQPPSDVAPMLDSLVSSPKNLVSSTAAADLDGMSTDGLGTETDIWGQSEFNRERSDSNVLSDQDNMLIGGDIFGDNDVTEDDFRFFDEQPDEMDLGIADYAPTSDISPPKSSISKASTPKAVHETPASTPMSTNPPLQDADVFKKPELKHARSYMSPATSQTVSGKPVSSPKREGSPFSPEAVFKRVRGSLEPPRETSAAMPPPGQRRSSIFDKVDIGPALPLINKKYEKGGIFSFDPGVALTKNHVHHVGSLPETDYLRRHSRRNRKLKELPTQAPAAHMSPFNKQDGGSASDEDASSVQSEEDDTSYTSDEAFSPAKATFRRGAQEDDVASQVTSLRDAEAFEESEQHLVVELPRLSKPGPEELPLARIFADPEPMGTQLSLTDETLVAVAQVLTEQASTGFVDIGDMRASEGHGALSTSHRRTLASRIRESLEALHETVPACFTGWTRNSLKGLLDLPDVPLGGQAMRMGMSNRNQAASGQDGNVAAQLRPSSLYPIPYHRLEVRRAETSLSVLPTAVSFWDSLGLAPASGSKEVQTLCMFPRWTGMQDNVRSFLESMGGMYELLKLGSFVRLKLSDDMEPGMMPFEVDRISTSPDASVSGHGSALLDSMTALQSALAALPASEVNIAVLMVYSPGNPTSIVEACLAFQQFTELYAKQAATKEGGPPGLTLQLVSVDLISSATTLVVPSSTALVKLCLELYDRCAALGGPSPAPAIVLEQPLPRVIDFKLTSNPSASLIHENSCFHVSYACSQDERWVSAAWTDDRGTQQSTASYCLGRKGRPLSTTMHEVAHEIWETTLDMIAFRKVHWRLIITKVGNMDNAEIDFWSDLMRTESRAHVAVILMTVDTNPSLQIVPPSVQVAASSAGFYTTPVSTPQGSMVSPEQTSAQAAPPTPTTTDGNTDPEADAILLDLTDQTYGAVVGHRLNVSQTPLELQPSLVSGFLIKKTSKEVEEPPVVMEVNLVHTEGTGRPYEPLLREMLNNFRGLNTLARSRGVVDKATDVRPWHVAAAEKAVRALYMLL